MTIPHAPFDGCFRGVVGVSHIDITPPEGIHARCWGAAKHDVAEGVHRPLTLTTITIEQHRIDFPLVLISADLMSWRSREAEEAVLEKIVAELRSTGWDWERFMFCLGHTHSAPSIRSDDASKPGGELIGPYQQQLVRDTVRSIQEAQSVKVPATIDFRYGRCDLATNRDLPDPERDRIVCGFNPGGEADDTLLVGRVCDETGRIIATIVNYACHPTTLAWENRLLSPDWIGGMREIVQKYTGAPCMFLQGASGELAPAEQYVTDPAIADRHGRRVGFAVLSTLQGMDPVGTKLVYGGVVESGAPLAVWKRVGIATADLGEERRACSPATRELSNVLAAKKIEVELSLKPMPTAAEIESAWRDCGDEVTRERLARQRALRKIVGDGATTKMGLWAWRIGDAAMIGQRNEAYSLFQTELRKRFAPRRIAVMNLVNGSAGYLAPRERYGKDIYQVWQSPFAEGSLEILIDAAEKLMREMFQD